MRLSTTDKIEVFKLCPGCFGAKVIKDDAGNEIPCPHCHGAGEVTEHVMLREFVEFFGQEIVNTVRLRTGIKF